LELRDGALLGTLGGLRPWPFGGQGLAAARATLLAPGAQMRAVDALAAEQLAQLTAFGARVGFGENPLLLLVAEIAALTAIVLGLGHHLGGLGLRFRHWFSTSLAPRIVHSIRKAAVSPVIGTGGRRATRSSWKSRRPP